MWLLENFLEREIVKIMYNNDMTWPFFFLTGEGDQKEQVQDVEDQQEGS